MVDISEAVSEEEVKALAEADVDPNPVGWAEGARVHVNGDIFGHMNPHKLVEHFKRRRRSGRIRSR